MGVAVLNPRDCLHNSFPNQRLIYPPSLKQPKNQNRSRSNRSPPSRKKVSPKRNTSPTPPPEASGPTVKNLVMGQVKILKRGEELAPEEVDKITDLGLGSTRRLGPDPELVASQIEVKDKITGFYAGSGFFVSPHPSSLPMPAFFAKKGGDDATTNLRRLLRLDF